MIIITSVIRIGVSDGMGSLLLIVKMCRENVKGKRRRRRHCRRRPTGQPVSRRYDEGVGGGGKRYIPTIPPSVQNWVHPQTLLAFHAPVTPILNSSSSRSSSSSSVVVDPCFRQSSPFPLPSLTAIAAVTAPAVSPSSYSRFLSLPPPLGHTKPLPLI